MSYIPRDNVTPLIIVGRQRAGTRYITNLLNQFKAVTIQGEIPPPVMRSVERLFDDIERYHQKNSGDARGEKRYKMWSRKRGSLMFSVWANCSNGKRQEAGKGCKYYGYKRPGHEVYFDRYEEMFAVKPIYVYCIRNFVENYLSVASRWPWRSVKVVAKEYLESLRTFQKMRASAPDRTLVFNLDDLITRGYGYIEESILQPLDLEPGPTLRRRLENMEAANRTQAIPGVERRRELTRRESAYIRKHPELQEEFLKLCRYYMPG